MAAPGRLCGCRWPSPAEPEPGRGCAPTGRAWRGGASCGGRDAGRRGGPGRWCGTSRGGGVPEPGLPAGRRCMRPRAGGERPGCPWWRSEGPAWRALPATGEGREARVFEFLSGGEGAARRLSVPRGFMGGRGPLEAAGGKAAAFLPENKEPGRGGGLHSSPRLAHGGFARGCRKHFPNSGLGGRNPLLFCSQERKKWGGGSCCHVVVPVF